MKIDKVSHSDIFRFQDIAYVFMQFYKFFGMVWFIIAGNKMKYAVHIV